MRKRNRNADADEAEIDLTPMLDVVFIMLIFFIVVASFLREIGLDVNRPDTNIDPPESDATSIVVTIRGNDQIFMDDRIVDIKAVRSSVAQRLASDPEQGFSIITESGASSKTLLSVADGAREAGVKQVNWPAEKTQ
jgi:biopolymer transport protein ExbD